MFRIENQLLCVVVVVVVVTAVKNGVQIVKDWVI